jgi:hypothetical protein
MSRVSNRNFWGVVIVVLAIIAGLSYTASAWDTYRTGEFAAATSIIVTDEAQFANFWPSPGNRINICAQLIASGGEEKDFQVRMILNGTPHPTLAPVRWEDGQVGLIKCVQFQLTPEQFVDGHNYDFVMFDETT